MSLTRILRFFGLRSHHDHAAPMSLADREARSIRRELAARIGYRSNASTSGNSNATPTNATNPHQLHRPISMIHIPDNEPAEMDWSLSGSMSSLKSSRQEEIDDRSLVLQLILDELQSHGHKSVSRGSPSSMRARAQALSRVYLEGSRSETIAQSSTPRAGMTSKEEKKLRKCVARAIRSEEKQQKKLDKLNRKRAKQYARAQDFFEQPENYTSTTISCSSLSSTSLQSECYDFDDVEMDEPQGSRRRQQRVSASSASSSLAQFSPHGSTSSRTEKDSTHPPRMEFLFFSGCPDDTSLAGLDIGHRRIRTNASACNNAVPHRAKESCTKSIKINPTLVRDMPRPFSPTLAVSN